MLEHILLNRVKRKVLLMAIAAKKLPMHKNWDQGSWRYGATLTGDVGHQVQADLDLAIIYLSLYNTKTLPEATPAEAANSGG